MENKYLAQCIDCCIRRRRAMIYRVLIFTHMHTCIHTHTSNLVQGPPPECDIVQESSDTFAGPTQRFGFAPLPGLETGQHWHLHLLDLTVKDVSHILSTIQIIIISPALLNIHSIDLTLIAVSTHNHHHNCDHNPV